MRGCPASGRLEDINDCITIEWTNEGATKQFRQNGASDGVQESGSRGLPQKAEVCSGSEESQGMEWRNLEAIKLGATNQEP